MIKFMLIALMACTGAVTEEAPVAETPAAPATELTVTVEEAPADATAASTLPADATAVEATTETVETTETTSAK